MYEFRFTIYVLRAATRPSTDQLASAAACRFTRRVTEPIPSTMRAVVYRGVDDLRVETVPVPRIAAGDILVRVAACGVCPTDIKKIHYGTVPPPRIFGHETAGTIVKVGAKVRGFRVGERVGLHHHVPCLDCHFCRHHAFARSARPTSARASPPASSPLAAATPSTCACCRSACRAW
jgi:hypothetical protein